MRVDGTVCYSSRAADVDVNEIRRACDAMGALPAEERLNASWPVRRNYVTVNFRLPVYAPLVNQSNTPSADRRPMGCV